MMYMKMTRDNRREVQEYYHLTLLEQALTYIIITIEVKRLNTVNKIQLPWVLLRHYTTIYWLDYQKLRLLWWFFVSHIRFSCPLLFWSQISGYKIVVKYDLFWNLIYVFYIPLQVPQIILMVHKQLGRTWLC